MKRLHLAVFAAALAGCDRAAVPTDPAGALPPPSFAAQATLHFTNQRPEAFNITSPCSGGEIAFMGELREQVTAVGPQELLDQGRALRFENQAIVSGTGTDPVTGTTYYIRDVLHFGINSPTVEALSFTQTFQETLHAVSRGSGENFLIHVLFHMTALPSGEIASSIDVVRAECQG